MCRFWLGYCWVHRYGRHWCLVVVCFSRWSGECCLSFASVVFDARSNVHDLLSAHLYRGSERTADSAYALRVECNADHSCGGEVVTTLAAFLMSIIGPLVIQALIALGVGVFTITGIDLAVNQAVSWLTTGVGGIPANIANVMAMAGVFQGMSYVVGAVTTRMVMAGASSIKKWFIQ